MRFLFPPIFTEFSNNLLPNIQNSTWERNQREIITLGKLGYKLLFCKLHYWHSWTDTVISENKIQGATQKPISISRFSSLANIHNLWIRQILAHRLMKRGYCDYIKD